MTLPDTTNATTMRRQPPPAGAAGAGESVTATTTSKRTCEKTVTLLALAASRFSLGVLLILISPSLAAQLTEDDGRGSMKNKTSSSWARETKLLTDGGELNDYFGVSVSLDGDAMVVGASGDGSFRGAAYVFVRGRGAGAERAWTQQQKLVASDGKAPDYFGISVSMSGNTVVVGANGEEGLLLLVVVVRVRSGTQLDPVALEKKARARILSYKVDIYRRTVQDLLFVIKQGILNVVAA
jgi:hypothetical protein